MAGESRKRRRSALLGWWYLSISGGFFLLGLNRLLHGEAPWGVALRWLIALGFLLLGCWELRCGPTGRSH